MAGMALDMPLDEAVVRSLRVGDAVLLSGVLFTGRDAVHAYLAGGGTPPCALDGATIYHCGPVVMQDGNGWRITAAGPTTSAREEPYMATLVERFGLRGIIGKGGMGPRTLAACAAHGCAYFHAVGGAAQVLAGAIDAVRGVYLLERFGAPEAIWELQVASFPAVVTMDACGNSLHDTVKTQSTQRLAHLLTNAELTACVGTGAS